ncbi:MAG: hypothetical protein OXM58_11850 [Rhodospirillaceae bacterium]|nr:hypothetical protein [Rhodospirillaceae bacterium]MDE0619328.1 hypothetical protein [Rhodospirillaceae bacterium]
MRTASASAATPRLGTFRTFGPRSTAVALCEISVEVQIATRSDPSSSGATALRLGAVFSVTNRRSSRQAQSRSSSPRAPGDLVHDSLSRCAIVDEAGRCPER